jgi:hypothetical protein
VSTAQAVSAASVSIVLMDEHGTRVGEGSGVLIAPRLVLTSGHLITGKSKWLVTSADGKTKVTGSRGLTYDWMKYDSNKAHPRRNDIGVIHLDDSIRLDAYPKLVSDKAADGAKATRIRGTGAGFQTIETQLARVQSAPNSYLSLLGTGETLDTGGAVYDDRGIVGIVSGRGMTTGKLYVARTDALTKWLAPKLVCASGTSVRTYAPAAPKPEDCDDAGSTSSSSSGGSSSGTNASSSSSGNNPGGGGPDNCSEDNDGHCSGSCGGNEDNGGPPSDNGSSGSSGNYGNTGNNGSSSGSSGTGTNSSSGGNENNGGPPGSSGSSGNNGNTGNNGSSGSSGTGTNSSSGGNENNGGPPGSSGSSGTSGSTGNDDNNDNNTSSSSSGNYGNTSSSGSSGAGTSSSGGPSDTEVCSGPNDNPEVCPPEPENCSGNSCGGGQPDDAIDYGNCSCNGGSDYGDGLYLR